MKKTAEEMLKKNCYRQFTDDEGSECICIGLPEAISAIHAYYEQFTSIWAITNLDAEDLGSSILRTYYTSEDAYTELELIESGEHPEFFSGGTLEVFEIKLPSPPKQ